MGKQRSAVEHTSAAEAATWAIAGGTAEAVPFPKSLSSCARLDRWGHLSLRGSWSGFYFF